MAATVSGAAGSPGIAESPASRTVFLGDPVTFRVVAGGTEPLGYQWYRNGVAVGGATANTLIFATTAADDQAQFTVRVSNSIGTATSAPASLTIDWGEPGPAQTNRWIEVTQVWRYDVRNTDLGTAWTQASYGDSGWAAGGGLLYVEESALPAPKTTALPLTAGSLPMTCYFRTRFTNDIVNAYELRLEAQVAIDDGMIGYLNGAEAFRLGMPADAVAHSTAASRTVGNAAWEGPFDWPTTHLVAGVNLLAVEVHQVNGSSSDIVMGLTLDAVWRPRLRDTSPPVVARTTPAAASTVVTLTQIEVQFSERVQGVDAADLRINGRAATALTSVEPDRYLFEFASPQPGPVSVTWAPDHGITDRSADAHAFVGASFGYVIEPNPAPLTARLSGLDVTQSSDASSAYRAVRAIDGAVATFSLTADLPGSYWLGTLARPYPVERIEIVNRAAPDDNELAGLTLRLFNLDDQVVFETVLSNPGSAALAVVRPPPGTLARSLWIGLRGTQTNAAGNYRVGLAEVRLFGLPNIPFGPEPFLPGTNSVRVWQSSEYPGYPASNAVDDNPASFTHTANVADGFWMADLGRALPIERVEIVNRSSCCAERLAGLVLRIFNGNSNSVASAVLPNPGLGGTWTYTPVPGTQARWLRVGLENGQANGANNHYVTLAEARVFSGGANVLGQTGAVPVVSNLASFKPSHMLRLDESVPAASRANDDNYATETKTTLRTVDGYWEVDLEATYALYGLRAIAASGIGSRLTNTTVRLYDAAHESVHAQKVSGGPEVFDVDLNGPIFARYVRVGLEDKERTDPAGGIEFYIGFREVEVFGRPTNQVGILSFSASAQRVAAGQPVTLSWTVADVRRVELRPALGSVGSYTASNGVGSLTLTPTQSTEFLLVATGPAGTFARAIGVEVDGQALPVRLSEIVADNKHSLRDGYGEASDWIELHNPGIEPVRLAGWGLSDDPARPLKWTFPEVQLAAHGTLLVFASGRSAPVDPAGHLHANFRLDQQGETVWLTASDGVTRLDQVTYPELDTDLAYGRDLEGAWTFLEPTPGLVNTAPTYLGWLKPPTWSHTAGFYDAAFILTLTHQSPGASLLYSLDGAEPRIPYSSGLPITRTRAVRTQAVHPGYKPSRSQTRTFLFVNDVITSSVMNTAITQNPAYAPRLRPGLLALPSLSLCVTGQPEYEEKEGSLEILWPDGRAPDQVNCGISRFGNAWTKFEKRSFRIKCRPRYGEAKLSAPLFDGFDRGVLVKTAFDKLDLRSGSQDMSQRGFYMAGRFVEDAMLDMGSLNPHGRFVHVYLNGVYWGQYDCRELLEEHFLADYLGGASQDYVAVRGNDNVGDDFVLGTPDPPHLEPWENARSARNSYNTLRRYVDIPHLIDFMLLWNYGNCESEFRACGPIVPGGGFKFWIADADGFLRTSALGSNRTSRDGPSGLFGGLRAENHPDFKTLLADRIYRHFFNDGALTPAANDARLAARLEEIRDSLVAECARWGYRTPANWQSAAADIRSTLFPARTTQLIGYLRSAGLYPALDPPAFNQYGGLVPTGFQPALTSTSGTIYYTLDGSDPRLPGGGLAPGARVWSSGAVTIANDLMLNARVRTAGGAWSALAQPHYRLATRRSPTARDLLITEIHYRPLGSAELEFVELWNASPHLLDLSGLSLSNAVRFVFPKDFALGPGAFVLVVEDTAAFAARYQTAGAPYYYPSLNVAGAWIGALDNAGETLSLVASNGVELSAVPFKPTGDWPSQADGKGSSLELVLPPDAATNAEMRAWLAAGRNWRPSSLFRGSPGRLDPFVSAVRINEVLSHSEVGDDWIELHNSSDQPVDLTGWTLTDDLARPARWTFPANSAMQPGDFWVLAADQLGFAISELGEEISLLQLSGTNVLRILDRVDLPAATRQETLGLYLRSDGALDFTELLANTPGGPNAPPRVGPVVISEILFAPLAGKAEFLELANLTGATVPLFDPLRPTNLWKLDGVGAFSFPAGATLAPYGTAIVCSTDPAAFRAQYAVPGAVPVFGPWSGALDDDGETLKLLQPGTPELNGTVPYYRVDRVGYRTQAPWPAIAAGASLERVPLEAYGNDPAHWRAGPVGGTPGVATPSLRIAAAYRAGELRLSFPVLPGQTYQVEYCADLGLANWRLLREVIAVEAGTVTVTDPEPSASPSRFYRVRWLR
ncbi:MAG: hypothetical protein FJ387_24580 [Verrucomicrobia bacterium]|nr:hypothetical protein [Verrucomicrobiota bacterium]